jgi:hypothetical protein
MVSSTPWSQHIALTLFILHLIQHETSDAAAVGLSLFYFRLNTGVHNLDDVPLGIGQFSS